MSTSVRFAMMFVMGERKGAGRMFVSGSLGGESLGRGSWAGPVTTGGFARNENGQGTFCILRGRKQL